MRPARGREDSPEAEGYRLRVDQTVSERFRGYGALVVYASGLTNTPDAVETRTLEGLDEATRQRTKTVDGVVDKVSSWKGH